MLLRYLKSYIWNSVAELRHKYKGLAFLIEFYDVEHLQSMNETIDDLLIVCQKNGGTLA